MKVFLFFSRICLKKDQMNPKKLAKTVLKTPGQALEVGANVGIAFASRSPKAAKSSLTEVNDFYHTRKGLYLGKFV